MSSLSVTSPAFSPCVRCPDVEGKLSRLPPEMFEEIARYYTLNSVWCAVQMNRKIRNATYLGQRAEAVSALEKKQKIWIAALPECAVSVKEIFATALARTRASVCLREIRITLPDEVDDCIEEDLCTLPPDRLQRLREDSLPLIATAADLAYIYQRAEGIHGLPEGAEKEVSLLVIARAYLQKEKFARAAAEAERITNQQLLSIVGAEICRALPEHFERESIALVERITTRITDHTAHAMVLHELASRCMRRGYFTEVARVVGQILDPALRATVACYLCQETIPFTPDFLSCVERIAGTIENPQLQARVAVQLVKKCIAGGALSEADRLARGIRGEPRLEQEAKWLLRAEIRRVVTGYLQQGDDEGVSRILRELASPFAQGIMEKMVFEDLMAKNRVADAEARIAQLPDNRDLSEFTQMEGWELLCEHYLKEKRLGDAERVMRKISGPSLQESMSEKVFRAYIGQGRTHQVQEIAAHDPNEAVRAGAAASLLLESDPESEEEEPATP